MGRSVRSTPSSEILCEESIESTDIRPECSDERSSGYRATARMIRTVVRTEADPRIRASDGGRIFTEGDLDRIPMPEWNHGIVQIAWRG